jgi:hypothetical protein
MISPPRYSSKNRQEAAMHMRVLFGMIVAATLALAPSAAQTPAPDSLAAARELVTSMRMTDQLKTMLPIIMQGLRPAIVQDRPEVGREYDALLPTMLEIANRRMAGYVDEMAAIYARNFTAGELGQLTAFYKTPTGQKLLARMPDLLRQSMVVGQQFGQSLAVELQTRMKDELRKKGFDL